MAAERTPVMGALIAGRLSLVDYRELLVNLHAIYEGLETMLARHSSDAACGAIDLPGLTRLASLRRDLDGFEADGIGGPATLRPAASAYVARLLALGAQQPELLVAHAYVRYLGDLSGGQVLGRIVGQKLKAPVAFYEFGSAEQAASLARAFRRALDALVLSDAQINAIVDEAVGAFDRHVALFDELEGRSRERRRDDCRQKKCGESLDSRR
jgi:heme oxygenase